MNILDRLLAMRRNKQRRLRDAWIESLFTLEERSGQMWLLCDGHAIHSFPYDAHSEDMLDAAENARRTAKAYDRHQNVADDEDCDDVNP